MVRKFNSFYRKARLSNCISHLHKEAPFFDHLLDDFFIMLLSTFQEIKALLTLEIL